VPAHVVVGAAERLAPDERRQTARVLVDAGRLDVGLLRAPHRDELGGRGDHLPVAARHHVAS
jgi:hypothetical protein